MTQTAEQEIFSRKRFEFGKNWGRFLGTLNDQRIEMAERSLEAVLGRGALAGKRFLDAGSGSGLFSLAARRLGAQVHSFDYDTQSVACTAELKHRYFPGDPGWIVETGSVLEKDYLGRLGQFDVVYSWGVLHHTGAMWDALANIAMPVREGGWLFISIYNDQGAWSRRWRKLKQIYNRLPRWARLPYTLAVMGSRELRPILSSTLKLKPSAYIASWLDYARTSRRGMSRWHDMVDWMGGYPFEVAKPEEIFDFFSSRGFSLKHLRTQAGGLGCNEYLFRREPGQDSRS
jgi:2-polyprenyl-3-methyl-5-hydroxy-6-metoxy-1,4-benzoquinol methylase